MKASGRQSGGGRGDLANMADLGINFIHLYDWNPPAAHAITPAFLAACSALGLRVAVPFNNAFCTDDLSRELGRQRRLLRQ